MRSVLVLYNCDYDPEPPPRGVLGRDRSDVARSAHDVQDGLASYGLDVHIMGIRGPELPTRLAEIRRLSPDLVFNLVESLNESSRHEIVVPALLDMLGIPFTGSPALALGHCLNKNQTRDILRGKGIPIPEGVVVENERDLARLDLPFPLFVKLAREDASVGISSSNLVHTTRALRSRVRALMREYDQAVVVEQYVEGRELNITVLGTENPVTLPFHEIDFSAMPAGRPHIVCYQAKWDEDSAEYHGTRPVLAQGITREQRVRMEKVAVHAFQTLGLRDYGRVDLRLAADGTPYVIDVNPNCDISPGAGVARAAKAAGMEYPQLVGRICELAWERAKKSADQDVRAA